MRDIRAGSKRFRASVLTYISGCSVLARVLLESCLVVFDLLVVKIGYYHMIIDFTSLLVQQKPKLGVSVRYRDSKLVLTCF